MVICADTSALFSLYANDVHTAKTVRWLTSQRQPISVTPLNEFELSNALRFAEWRGVLAAGEAAVFWAQFEGDRAAGRLVRQACNLASVLDEAMRDYIDRQQKERPQRHVTATFASSLEEFDSLYRELAK